MHILYRYRLVSFWRCRLHIGTNIIEIIQNFLSWIMIYEQYSPCFEIWKIGIFQKANMYCKNKVSNMKETIFNWNFQTIFCKCYCIFVLPLFSVVIVVVVENDAKLFTKLLLTISCFIEHVYWTNIFGAKSFLTRKGKVITSKHFDALFFCFWSNWNWW